VQAKILLAMSRFLKSHVCPVPLSTLQITRVSSAPVYSFRDVNIGTGIVGGYMSSFEEDGKAVARLGLRILKGEQPEDIPITRAPNFLYMFDWRQLKRWAIAEVLSSSNNSPSGTCTRAELSVLSQ
jgi:hypothetical protein